MDARPRYNKPLAWLLVGAVLTVGGYFMTPPGGRFLVFYGSDLLGRMGPSF